MRRAGLVLAAAMLLYAATADLPADAAVGLLLVATVVYTLGDLWHAPPGPALAYNLAAPDALGAYQGADGLLAGLARAVGPAVLTWWSSTAGCSAGWHWRGSSPGPAWPTPTLTRRALSAGRRPRRRPVSSRPMIDRPRRCSSMAGMTDQETLTIRPGRAGRRRDRAAAAGQRHRLAGGAWPDRPVGHRAGVDRPAPDRPGRGVGGRRRPAPGGAGRRPGRRAGGRRGHRLRARGHRAGAVRQPAGHRPGVRRPGDRRRGCWSTPRSWPARAAWGCCGWTATAATTGRWSASTRAAASPPPTRSPSRARAGSRGPARSSPAGRLSALRRPRGRPDGLPVSVDAGAAVSRSPRRRSTSARSRPAGTSASPGARWTAKCLRRVLVRRRVAAADVPAGQAAPQVHPVGVADGDAVRALVGGLRLGVAGLGQVLQQLTPRLSRSSNDSSRSRSR